MPSPSQFSQAEELYHQRLTGSPKGRRSRRTDSPPMPGSKSGMLDAMHGLIRALQEQGDLDGAIVVAQRLLQLDPEDRWPIPAFHPVSTKGLIAEAKRRLRAKLLGWKNSCSNRRRLREQSRGAHSAQFSRPARCAYGRQQWWPAQTALEVIVGAYLTQNTSWRGVERSIANLMAQDVMNLDGLRAIAEDELRALIRPSGYMVRKAAAIKAFVAFLDQQHGGPGTAPLKKPPLSGVNFWLSPAWARRQQTHPALRFAPPGSRGR